MSGCHSKLGGTADTHSSLSYYGRDFLYLLKNQDRRAQVNLEILMQFERSENYVPYYYGEDSQIGSQTNYVP